MPAGNYERDAVSGTEYGPGYVQEHMATIVAAASASPDYTQLKARKPPRGRDGAIAYLATRDVAANGTGPVLYTFMWIDDCTAADNGSTILKPTSLALADAGRWLLVGTLT